MNYGEVSGTLGFADGETGPKSITVPILDDGFITCSGLKFQVTLGAPTGAGVSLKTTQVLIQDGDQGRTQFRRTFEVRDRILATGPQWQAAVDSDSPWLTLSSYDGTGPSQVQAIVDITGLSVGQYVGIITVNAAGAVNSPAQLEVDLTVLSGGSVGQARSSASRPSAPNTPKNGGRQ